MSTQPSTRPASGLDATFRNPPTPDPANFVFNTPANWNGGRVPDGTGTIALEQFGEVTFSSSVTTIGAIALTGRTNLRLARGQTLLLTGAGLTLVSSGMATSGTIKGNILLTARDREATGYLGRTWEDPAGPIEGAVVNQGGNVVVGGPNDAASGEMTIKGHYIQGRADRGPVDLDAALQIILDGKGMSCLKVVGRADLLAHASVQMAVRDDQPVPYGKEFPLLTTTEGLRGVFRAVSVAPGFKASLRYDAKTVYATVIRA